MNRHLSLRLPGFGPSCFGLALIALSSLGGPALGQDLTPVLDRLERLERDIRTLNVQISRGETPSAATATGAKSVGVPSEPLPRYAAARLAQRMDALEQDLRASTGGQESLNHQVRQLAERLDKLVGDIDYRLGVIEGRLGIGAAVPVGQAPAASGFAGAEQPAGVAAAPSSTFAAGGIQAQTITPAPVPATAPATPTAAAPPAPAAPPGTLGTVSANAVDAVQRTRNTPAASASNVAAAPNPAPAAAPAQPAAVLPAGTPKDQYTYAFNLLRQTNYDQAEIALKQFIAAHGDNPLAGNARYWLGETFYVRADYQQAAQVFFEGFQADPKGAKAPDMLLKLGMSLGQLGKKKEACATFDKVAADFAKSSSRIKTALQRERQRTGCP